MKRLFLHLGGNVIHCLCNVYTVYSRPAKQPQNIMNPELSTLGWGMGRAIVLTGLVCC